MSLDSLNVHCIARTAGLVVLLGSVGLGCVSDKTVGNTPGGETETEGSSSDDMGSAGDGPAALCPDNPLQCPSTDLCGDTCGGVLSSFDEDGCARPRCEGDQVCQAGRTCVSPGDFGWCDSSFVSCELNGAICECGATQDCRTDVAFCVPDELAPPPAARCVGADKDSSFSLTPGLAGSSGTATCTVQSLAPLQLDCTGELAGMVEVDLTSNIPTPLSMGQAVQLRYDSVFQEEWFDEWLRITDESGLIVQFIAVQAETLLPPGADAATYWPTNVSIATADIGCPEALCPTNGSTYTGQALEVGQGPTALYARGESGEIPGKFGGEVPSITVFEAHEGACRLMSGHPGWYAFTIVNEPI